MKARWVIAVRQVRQPRKVRQARLVCLPETNHWIENKISKKSKPVRLVRHVFPTETNQ